MAGRIKTRPTAIKCTRCKIHSSVLSHTPFARLKIPMWSIGWLLNESIIRAPAVVTTTYIQKTLGIHYSSAMRLKRRLQILSSEYTPRIRALMSDELKQRYGKIKPLPEKDPNDINREVTRYMRDKRIPQADTVVLYSTQNTANKGRKRFRAHGQTASIYRADSLGGDQVGTLVNTITWRGGPAVYDSIPNQRAETLLPILERVIPTNTPLFTDEGYRWYKPHNKNLRTVNHNMPARRGTGKSRRRWQQNGVHTQAAEGRNGALKLAFKQYRYVKPKYSQLYLNEHSFIGALKYYGIEKIASANAATAVATVADTKAPYSRGGQCGVGISDKIVESLPQKFGGFLYKPNSLEDRRELHPSAKKLKQARQLLKELEDSQSPLRISLKEYLAFYEGRTITHRRRREKTYTFWADKLWVALSTDEYRMIGPICDSQGIPRRIAYRILGRWNNVGAARIVNRTKISREERRQDFDVKLKAATLPPLLYVANAERHNQWQGAIPNEYVQD